MTPAAAKILKNFDPKTFLSTIDGGRYEEDLVDQLFNSSETRSRVSFFMNRFRKLGFIDYHAGDDLQVHSSLLNVVLHD